MNKPLSLALLMLMIVSGVFLVNAERFSLAQSYTPVSGNITTDTTWTQANSPYGLRGTVDVAAGATLTIQAGVAINLNSQTIQVDGKLVAQGSSTNQIQFSDGEIDFTAQSAGWNQQSGSGCIVQNTVFNSTSVSASVAVRLDAIDSDTSSQINVTDSSIVTESNIYELAICGGSATISENTVQNLNVYWGSPTISDNIIDSLSPGWERFHRGCTALITGNTIRVVGGSGGSPIMTNNVITQGIMGYLDGTSQVISNNTIGGGVLITGNSPQVFGNTIVDDIGGYGGVNVNYGVQYDGACGSPLIEDNTISSTYTQTYTNRYGQTVVSHSPAIVLGGNNFDASIIDNVISGGNFGVLVEGEGTGVIAGNYISNQTSEWNSTGIAISTGASMSIIGNYIDNAKNGIVNVGKGTLKIENNTIAHDSVAIMLSYPATIQQNNIEDYQQNSVFMKPGGLSDVDATNNWWGIADAQTINQTIYDEKDNFALSQVDFVPFLAAPNPEAMPNTADILTVSAPTITTSSAPTPTEAATPLTEPTSNSTPQNTPISTVNNLQKEGSSTPLWVTLAEGVLIVATITIVIGVFAAARNKRQATRKM